MSSLQDFQNKFSTSTQSFVYPVDTVYRYTNEDFDALTRFSSFLRNVNDKVSIVNVNSVDAEKRLSNPNVNIATLNVSNTFENWKTDTVQLLYSLSPETTFSDSVLGDLIVQNVSTMNTTKVIQSNDFANSYMLNIMSAVGKWKYQDIKKKLLSSIGSVSGEVQRALSRVGELSGDAEISILNELREACKAAMYQIVKSKDPNNFLMTGLVEGEVFHMTYIRFYLRESIYKRIYLKGINESSDATLQYMKRILAELFVVCYYPLIHYLYAGELQKYFIARGDFMNMRAATAAKVTIVMNTVQAIINAQQANTGVAFPSTNSLQTIVQTLTAYLNRLSNPVFDDPNIKFGDIDIDVRNLSKKVNTQSMSIDDLKKYIAQNQLLIRSHADIYKGVNAALKSKEIQFALIVVFTIVVVIVSFLMIKFEFHLNHLTYGLLGIVVVFILINMIQSIIALTGN